MRTDVDVLIIGAGVAGLSAAFFLARSGGRNVYVAEKEPGPGRVASGRNAGMIHHYHADARTRSFLASSVKRLRRCQEESSDRTFFHQKPSLWYLPPEMDLSKRGPGDAGDRWVRLGEGRPDLLENRETGEGQWWICRDDGLLAPGEFISFLRREVESSGGHVETGEEVLTGWRTGDRWHVRTSNDHYRVRHVINAAGAHVDKVARQFGVSSRGFRPMNRYLFYAPESVVPERYGFLWDRNRDLYLRHMDGGTLMSVCEERPMSAGEGPGYPPPREKLARRVTRHYPSFRPVSLRGHWWCQRTAPPLDTDVFVIGEDEEHPGFIWAAGLYGHGMTGGLEVGKRAAVAVGDRNLP